MGSFSVEKLWADMAHINPTMSEFVSLRAYQFSIGVIIKRTRFSCNLIAPTL